MKENVVKLEDLRKFQILLDNVLEVEMEFWDNFYTLLKVKMVRLKDVVFVINNKYIDKETIVKHR